MSGLGTMLIGVLAVSEASASEPPSVIVAKPPGTMGSGLAEVTAPSDPQLAVCPDGTTLPGIDVSKWQGNVDWNAVANAGIVYAFIRVSHGVNTFDEYFVENWAEARAAGIHTGVYQYFEPGQDPIAQANILLDNMGALGPDDLVPVIDVESHGGLPPAQVAAAVGAWIDHVEAAIGKQPIIYTGKYFWQDYVQSPAYSDYPLWIAHYTDGCPNIPDQWSDWAFHQYTSSGSVAGVAGNVDRNDFNGDLAALLSCGGAPPGCGDGLCSGDEDADNCAGDCPACGIVDALGGTIDDGHACYGLFGPQEFWRHEAVGEGGGLAWTATTDLPSPSNYGIVELHFAEAGRYEIEVHLEAAFAASTMARYLVDHRGGTAEVVVDQAANAGWASLGEFEFDAGGLGQQIRLDDNTGEGGDGLRLCYDAVRLTRLDPPVSEDSGGESEDDGGASEDDGTEGGVSSEDDGALDESSSDDGALPPGFAGGEQADGCGCTTSTPVGAWWWLALVIAPLQRRRRVA